MSAGFHDEAVLTIYYMWSTINVHKLLTPFLILFSNKVIRAEIHELLVRIANREGPDQFASSGAV